MPLASGLSRWKMTCAARRSAARSKPVFAGGAGQRDEWLQGGRDRE